MAELEVAAVEDERPALTWEGIRYGLQELAKERGEWAGIPVPIAGLHVEDRYPWKEIEALGRREERRVCTDTDIDEGLTIRNQWHAYSRVDADVMIVWRDGRAVHGLVTPRGPAQRITMVLNTFEAVPAWSVEAEQKAVEKLAALVTPHALKCYLLTGGFLESSPRSHVTYFFRRLRPTLALRPDPKADRMRVIAALCLHPIAFYDGSWAGAMVPTDDVLAHLCLMRGDEHRYWRQANQHQVWAPEAGL